MCGHHENLKYQTTDLRQHGPRKPGLGLQSFGSDPGREPDQEAVGAGVGPGHGHLLAYVWSWATPAAAPLRLAVSLTSWSFRDPHPVLVLWESGSGGE